MNMAGVYLAVAGRRGINVLPGLTVTNLPVLGIRRLLVKCRKQENGRSVIFFYIKYICECLRQSCNISKRIIDHVFKS